MITPQNSTPRVIFPEPLTKQRRTVFGRAALGSGALLLVVALAQVSSVGLPDEQGAAAPDAGLADVPPVASARARTSSDGTAPLQSRPKGSPPTATGRAAAARTAGATGPSGAAPGGGLAAPGWLVVSSRPWGDLYIDGKRVGTTPQSQLWLAPGTHRVEIRRASFRSFSRSVSVESQRELRLTGIVLEGPP